jgi:hypothetical protein
LFVNLPGFGDTIRLTEHNTLMAPMALARPPNAKTPLDLFGKYPAVRTFLASVNYFYTVCSLLLVYFVQLLVYSSQFFN